VTMLSASETGRRLSSSWCQRLSVADDFQRPGSRMSTATFGLIGTQVGLHATRRRRVVTITDARIARRPNSSLVAASGKNTDSRAFLLVPSVPSTRPWYFVTASAMAPHSMDLPTRVLRDADAGVSSKERAAKYAVSRAWVDRLKQRRRETRPLLDTQKRQPPVGDRDVTAASVPLSSSILAAN
jgi:hypothetical protein